MEEAAGLFRITAPIRASKEAISRSGVPRGMSRTLKPSTRYKAAVLSFWGDGESPVRVWVNIGGIPYTIIPGNIVRVVVVADSTVELVAENTDTTTDRYHPTIEILSLSW
jgi:hypothetical protein